MTSIFSGFTEIIDGFMEPQMGDLELEKVVKGAYDPATGLSAITRTYWPGRGLIFVDSGDEDEGGSLRETGFRQFIMLPLQYVDSSSAALVVPSPGDFVVCGGERCEVKTMHQATANWHHMVWFGECVLVEDNAGPPVLDGNGDPVLGADGEFVRGDYEGNLVEKFVPTQEIPAKTTALDDGNTIRGI